MGLTLIEAVAHDVVERTKDVPLPTKKPLKLKAKAKPKKVAVKAKKVVAKAKTKAPAKKAKTKAKKAPEPTRALSPITKKFELKTNIVKGVCRLKGCSQKTETLRRKWCPHHQSEIRRAQLEANNFAWRERLAKGEAGHRMTYRGQPTMYARLITSKSKSK